MGERQGGNVGGNDRITPDDARVIGGWRVPLGPAADVQVVGTIVGTPDGRRWHASPTCSDITDSGVDPDSVGASVLRLADAVRIEWCRRCCARGYPLHGEAARTAVDAARRAAALTDPLLLEAHATGRHVAHTAGPHTGGDESPVSDLWVRFHELSSRLAEFEIALRALPGRWVRGRLIGAWLRGQIVLLRRLLARDDHRLGFELMARAFSARACFASLRSAAGSLPVATAYDAAVAAHDAWIGALSERGSFADARDAALGAIDRVVTDPTHRDRCRRHLIQTLPVWARDPAGPEWTPTAWIAVSRPEAAGRFPQIVARWGVDRGPTVSVLHLPAVVAEVLLDAAREATRLDPAIRDARVRQTAMALIGARGTCADLAARIAQARTLVDSGAVAFIGDD